MILILQTVHRETKISAIDIDAVSILNIELYPFLRLYLTLQYSLYYQNKTTEDITHTHTIRSNIVTTKRKIKIDGFLNSVALCDSINLIKLLLLHYLILIKISSYNLIR